jgi:hypothetical protein
MSLFHDIERRIDENLRKLFRGEGPQHRQDAIELQDAILDDVHSRIQTLRRGRRAFPYNEVVFRLLARDETQRATLYASFIEGNRLQQLIEKQLRGEGVEVAADLNLQIEILDDAEAHSAGPFASYRVREKAKPLAEGPRPMRFTLIDGAVFTAAGTRVHFGRVAEVLDDRRRVVRRNEVVVEQDDSVSRAHAHIQFQEGEYRLFDDGSTYGTSIIHEGRLIDVPKAGSRGIKVSDGDEIYLGRARLRFALEAS